MKKSRLALLPITLLAIAACSGSDDAGLTDEQRAAVDQFMDQEDAETLFDQDCVEDRIKDLSDEDAKAITDAGPDGNPELSPEGEALTRELASCIDFDALVDQIVSESGQQVDEECISEAREDFEEARTSTANADEGGILDGLLSSLIDCFEFELGS